MRFISPDSTCPGPTSMNVPTPLSTIERIDVVRHGDAITITVTADGFLRYMVRRIAGSLIEIGRGSLDARASSHDLRSPHGRVARMIQVADS